MKRLIIGITGASGVIMGYRLLQALHEMQEVETHLVMTEGAEVTFGYETEYTIEEVKSLADVVYDIKNMGAAIASGSFRTDGMIILPCSMKTVAGIASGFSENLLLRAADVCLKEGRKLVLSPRETPLSRIHLRNIKEIADCGGIILPPVLGFYSGADTVEKQIHHILGKILMQFDIELKDFRAWTGVC